MADIHIHRSHGLGLAKARKAAWKWAEAVEEKFDMECTVIERDDHDVVEFRRAGVDGRLRVEAGAFELTARLGLLLSAFSGRIESEIEAQLDKLLPPTASTGSNDAGEAGRAAPRRSAAKSAPQGAPRPRRR
jgi:putative polyhydroxyalkanoate system protein